jgi:hypothetical protein
LSIGIIATAIVLIIGYVIVSRLVGLAFRLMIPLVLLIILGGAGVFSGLMPERPPADSYAPYGQAQHRSEADIGDLRLRDVADIAVDTIRSVLQGSLALLNGVSEPEPRRERRGRTNRSACVAISPMRVRPTLPMTRGRVTRGADGEHRAILRSLSDLPAEEARSRKRKAPGPVSGPGDPDAQPCRNLDRALSIEDLEGCLVQRQRVMSACHTQSLAQTARP